MHSESRPLSCHILWLVNIPQLYFMFGTPYFKYFYLVIKVSIFILRNAHNLDMVLTLFFPIHVY